MKQVCLKQCQLRLDGKIHLVGKGQVVDYPDAHTCLKSLEAVEAELDFTTASKETLMETKWKFEDADAAMVEAFNKKLTREQGTKKSEVVEQIMDIRFRALDYDPNLTVSDVKD